LASRSESARIFGCPDPVDPENRKNRIVSLLANIKLTGRHCKPVRNLQKFPDFQIRLIQKRGKIGFFTFGK
jgi:hypothetical protein